MAGGGCQLLPSDAQLQELLTEPQPGKIAQLSTGTSPAAAVATQAAGCRHAAACACAWPLVRWRQSHVTPLSGDAAAIDCRNDWQAGNISWSAMPNLAPQPNGAIIKSIGANFVNWLGTSPQPQVASAHAAWMLMTSQVRTVGYDHDPSWRQSIMSAGRPTLPQALPSGILLHFSARYGRESTTSSRVGGWARDHGAGRRQHAGVPPGRCHGLCQDRRRRRQPDPAHIQVPWQWHALIVARLPDGSCMLCHHDFTVASLRGFNRSCATQKQSASCSIKWSTCRQCLNSDALNIHTNRVLMRCRPYRHAAYGDIPADSLVNSRAAFRSSEAGNVTQRPTLTLQYR
jgi:hypothetical protein